MTNKEQQVTCSNPNCSSMKLFLLSINLLDDGNSELNLWCSDCGALQTLPIKGQPEKIMRPKETKKSTYLQ